MMDSMKKRQNLLPLLRLTLPRVVIFSMILASFEAVSHAGELSSGGKWKREDSKIESDINDIIYTQTLFGRREEYVTGKYVCWNFSNDNCEQFKSLGYGCWNFNFGCTANMPWGTTNHHAINVIDFTDSGVEAGHRRLCLVEPQRCMIEGARDVENESMVIGCWIVPGREGDNGTASDRSLEPLLEITDGRLKERYSWFRECSGSVFSDREYGICEHNETGVLRKDCHTRFEFDNSIFQLPF